MPGSPPAERNTEPAPGLRLLSAPDDLPRTLQALPSAAARLCLDVERTIKGVCDGENGEGVRNCHCVVALSGGADSTALLLILHYLRQRLGLSLSALHVDHGLRPESAAEARAAVTFCHALGIPLAVHTLAVDELAAVWRVGTEEAGRKARYDLLAAALPSPAADWICTGHHLGDLAEDVLMRLVRGCGWPALGGMRLCDPARRILRPLLLTEKDRLEAFLATLGVSWTEDPSNASDTYLRNRMRHGVIPLLTAENPGFLDQVRDLWQLAHIDADFWETRTAATLNAAPAPPSHVEGEASAPHDTAHGAESIRLPKTTLTGLHQAERLRLFKEVLRRMGEGQARAETLLALDAAWVAGRGGTRFMFAGCKTATVRRGDIIFSGGPPAEDTP